MNKSQKIKALLNIDFRLREVQIGTLLVCTTKKPGFTLGKKYRVKAVSKISEDNEPRSWFLITNDLGHKDYCSYTLFNIYERHQLNNVWREFYGI
jgi:hypothetical protein